MKTGITLILLCLLPLLAFADPEIETRDMAGFRGPVKTVIQTSGLQEYRNGQWVPSGKPAASTTWEFDAAGRLLRRESKQADGEVIVIAYTYDAGGRVMSYRLNRSGRVYTGDMQPPASSISVTYQYDHQTGRLQKKITLSMFTPPPPPGSTEPPAPVPILSETEYSYDAAGHLIGEREKGSNGAIMSSTTWTYDAEGREVTRVDTGSNGVEWARTTTRYAEDGGKTITTTSLDGNGKVILTTTQRFDPQERLIEVLTKHEGNDTGREVTTYTEFGHLTRSDPEYRGVGSVSSITFYDANDRLLTSTSTDEKGIAMQETYAYDSRGNPVLYARAYRERKGMPPVWRLADPFVLSSYVYDGYGNWITRFYTEPVLDRDGNSIIEGDMPKMKYSKATREITYFEK